MCGRYASSRKPEDLAEEFEIDRNRVTETVAEQSGNQIIRNASATLATN